MSEAPTDLYPLDVSAALDGLAFDLEGVTDMPRYVVSLQREYRPLPALQLLGDIARLPAMVKRLNNEYDPTRNTARSFLYGALLALRAVDYSPSNWALPLLSSETLRIPGTDRPYESKEQLFRRMEQGVREMGAYGVRLAGSTAEELEAWGLAATNNFPDTEHFTCGFGFSLAAAEQVVTRKRNEAFENFMAQLGCTEL